MPKASAIVPRLCEGSTPLSQIGTYVLVNARCLLTSFDGRIVRSTIHHWAGASPGMTAGDFDIIGSGSVVPMRRALLGDALPRFMRDDHAIGRLEPHP